MKHNFKLPVNLRCHNIQQCSLESFKFTAKIKEDEEGELILPLPDHMFEHCAWHIDDVIDVRTGRNKQVLELKNLSLKRLKLSQFRRNLNSICNNILNPNHPLKRVIVDCEKPFICISVEAHEHLTSSKD